MAVVDLSLHARTLSFMYYERRNGVIKCQHSSLLVYQMHMVLENKGKPAFQRWDGMWAVLTKPQLTIQKALLFSLARALAVFYSPCCDPSLSCKLHIGYWWHLQIEKINCQVGMLIWQDRHAISSSRLQELLLCSWDLPPWFIEPSSMLQMCNLLKMRKKGCGGWGRGEGET